MLDFSDLLALEAMPDAIADVPVAHAFLGAHRPDGKGTPFVGSRALADFSGLSRARSLKTLDLSHTQIADLALLLRLASLVSLDIGGTPASDAGRDRRLDMLSRLPPERQAIEVPQYLRGEHPDFRDPPGNGRRAATATPLAQSSPVALDEVNGRLVATNAGEPDRLAPRELHLRVGALRAHLAQLLAEADGRQVPEAIRARLRAYAEPLEEDMPVFLLLDGPMSFLRGGLNDPYTTEALDGGFVAAWGALVDMLDALRPLLLPPEEPDDLPDLAEEATADLGQSIVSEIEEAFDTPSVDESAIEALDAARDYFESAKQDRPEARGWLRRGFKAVGGIVAGVVSLGAGGATLHTWAATPEGAATIARLQPILERIEALFPG